jgi:hypothetical protein
MTAVAPCLFEKSRLTIASALCHYVQESQKLSSLIGRNVKSCHVMLRDFCDAGSEYGAGEPMRYSTLGPCRARRGDSNHVGSGSTVTHSELYFWLGVTQPKCRQGTSCALGERLNRFLESPPSIRCRPLHIIYHEHLHRPSLWFQPQPQLILQRQSRPLRSVLTCKNRTVASPSEGRTGVRVRRDTPG